MYLDAKTARILIVDDHKNMRCIMRSLMIQMGFSKIDEATNARMALEMTDANRYELIIFERDMESQADFNVLKNIGVKNNIPLIDSSPMRQAVINMSSSAKLSGLLSS